MSSKIGIIGGTGLYEMEGFTDIDEIEMDTPFGMPSDKFIIGKLEGKEVVFLPRHGKGHRILPTEVNSAANIYGMKKLGVKYIFSISAVGSLKQEIAPKDIIVPDQVIDRTKSRPNTLYGNGLVVHISFAEPFCNFMRKIIFDSAKKVGAKVHNGGKYVCMEGPAFSTKAESFLYRSWDASIIGMTALPEAKFAREAEICYAIMALATDYDCWHEVEEAVSCDVVIRILQENSERAKRIVKEAVKSLDIEFDCSCHHALAPAIMTDKKMVSKDVYKKVELFIGKYF